MDIVEILENNPLTIYHEDKMKNENTTLAGTITISNIKIVSVIVVLHQMSNNCFSYIMTKTNYILMGWWGPLCISRVQINLYSGYWHKSAGIHVHTLGHSILTPIQPVCDLTP